MWNSLQRLSRELERAEDKMVAKGARIPLKSLLGAENMLKKCIRPFQKDRKFVSPT